MSVPAYRTVTIETQPAFYGTYGTIPVGPGYGWPTAEPDEFLDYAVNVAAALSCDETITQASLEISPAGAGELIAAFLNVTGPLISWWGLGGVLGRTYRVKIRIETSAQRVPSWTIDLPINPFRASWPLPRPQCPGYGRPLLWSAEGNPMSWNFGPQAPLQAATFVSTGNSQLTAAPMTLSKALVIGVGNGVVLPKASTFCGQTMPVYNRTAGPITIYPYSGDQIESLGVNAGTILQNEGTANFSVAITGQLILS